MIPAAVAALGLTAALVAACSASAEPVPPDTEGLDTELLEDRLADVAALTDGSVVVEVRGGNDTWTEAVGTRSLEEDAAEARPDDLVRIGSTTKSMVAAVVLQLDDEGEIDLDDPFGDYMPGLLPYEEDPTIRQLLQHTGGVPDFLPRLYPSLEEGDVSDVREGYRDHYEPEELIAIATQDPQMFEPGEGWSYSNTGYTALALLIEDLTGHSLQVELRERVFDPAGLDRTYLPEPDAPSIQDPYSVPYVTTGEPDDPYFDATEASSSQLGASGGVVSTVGEVNGFYRALTDGTLLTEEQLTEATDYVDTGGDFDYGLGLGSPMECPGAPDEVILGHNGDALGHQTQSFHSYDGGRQITLSWNLDDKHGYGDPEKFEESVAALLNAALCGADS